MSERTYGQSELEAETRMTMGAAEGRDRARWLPYIGNRLKREFWPSVPASFEPDNTKPLDNYRLKENERKRLRTRERVYYLLMVPKTPDFRRESGRFYRLLHLHPGW